MARWDEQKKSAQDPARSVRQGRPMTSLLNNPFGPGEQCPHCGLSNGPPRPPALAPTLLEWMIARLRERHPDWLEVR